MDNLSKQAKNNINIIDITPVDVDSDYNTFIIAVRYEFQWRPKHNPTPHWTKGCVLLNLSNIESRQYNNIITDRIIDAVREARKELEV